MPRGFLKEFKSIENLDNYVREVKGSYDSGDKICMSSIQNLLGQIDLRITIK